MKLVSQEMRKLAPELDPLRLGTGWKKEDLGKVQVMVESTYGDSHPGSGHLNILVEEVRKGIAEEGGFGARYNCTDICDGESQGTDGINYSLASREMIANMIEIHANATPFDAGVYLSSCDHGRGTWTYTSWYSSDAVNKPGSSCFRKRGRKTGSKDRTDGKYASF